MEKITLKDSTTNSNDPLVYLDWMLLDRARIDLGLSKKLICTGEISKNTLDAIEEGKGVYPATAAKLAALVRCRVGALYSPRDRRYLPPPTPSNAIPSEWMTTEKSQQGRHASNELYYVVFQMKHRHTANRMGRGKFYVPLSVSEKTKIGLREKLSRHADICARVGIHRNIALNLTSTPVGEHGGWWVIDEWVGEQSLADRLETGRWPTAELPKLLLDISSGLRALHEKNVVFRELAPARVLISDIDGHAVLTDFELGKVLDTSYSVSSDWPEDPFRAPEIDGAGAGDGPGVSVRADFYSLAKTVVAALTTPLDEADSPKNIFQRERLPKPISEFLIKCLSRDAEKRPESLAPLVKQLEVWAKKADK